MPIEVFTREEAEELVREIRALQVRVTYTELAGDQWVPPAVAARITGRSEKTLQIERDRPGTLLRYKMHGRTPLYSLLSLRAYNEARGIVPTLTGHRYAEAVA